VGKKGDHTSTIRDQRKKGVNRGEEEKPTPKLTISLHPVISRLEEIFNSVGGEGGEVILDRVWPSCLEERVDFMRLGVRE